MLGDIGIIRGYPQTRFATDFAPVVCADRSAFPSNGEEWQ
jgi:hypothetical protein